MLGSCLQFALCAAEGHDVPHSAELQTLVLTLHHGSSLFWLAEGAQPYVHEQQRTLNVCLVVSGANAAAPSPCRAAEAGR